MKTSFQYIIRKLIRYYLKSLIFNNRASIFIIHIIVFIKYKNKYLKLKSLKNNLVGGVDRTDRPPVIVPPPVYYVREDRPIPAAPSMSSYREVPPPVIVPPPPPMSASDRTDRPPVIVPPP